MITFSFDEIVFSLISAVLYGVFFAIGMSAIGLVIDVISTLPIILKSVFIYDYVLTLPQLPKNNIGRQRGAIYSFLSVIAFTLGFILLSYLCLDGVIRIYMILLSFASFYLSKTTFFDYFNKLLLCIFYQILRCFLLALRVVILPFKRFVCYVISRIRTL